MPQQITDPRQLVSVYKKNGSFDKQRKLLLENFKASETHANLMLKLKLIVEGKVKSDPTILMKNRGKVGALIQGSIIQQKAEEENSILSIVDNDIQEKIIDSPEFHKLLKKELNEIKRKLMGISDEQWEAMESEKQERMKASTPNLPEAPQQTSSLANDDGKPTVSSPSTFGGYKLKPDKVIKAPKIKINQLKY